MPLVERADTGPQLRAHLAAKCRATIPRLTDSTGFYDFSAELDRHRDRLIDIETGRDLLVYRFEIPADVAPPGDGQHVFTLRGNRLVPAEYERTHRAP